MDKKTIISSKPDSFWNTLGEVYSYRELLWSLALRDLKVKYAQTLIGFLWALINPLVTLLILSFVFGQIANVNTNGVPHQLFTIIGLLGWTYFSNLLIDSSDSLIQNQNMIQKIYFPKIILPLSKAISGLIDFLITLFLVIVFMFYYGVTPSGNILYFPFFLILAIFAGLAGGFWISALTVRYRDFRFIVNFLVRIGLYATPIAYASSSVPEKFQFIFNLNPLVGVIEGMRWCLLDMPTNFDGIYISVIVLTLVFITGLFYFNRVVKYIADII